jgi:hypothetical protein
MHIWIIKEKWKKIKNKKNLKKFKKGELLNLVATVQCWWYILWKNAKN